MAIPSSVNDLWEVVIEGRQEGQLTANVLHFECVGATADTEVNLIQVLMTCFITHMLPVITASWQLERIRWKKVAPVLGVEQISIPTGTTTGGGNAAALPSFVAAVISKRTLTGGRSHRGRFYMPGVPENQTVNSALDPALPYYIALLAFATCVITNFVHPDPIGGDLFNLIVYSRKLGGASFPYTLPGVTQVREFVPTRQLGTMRSRKVGRGA